MKRISLLIIFFGFGMAFAQEALTVTEIKPVTINGLKAGYNIINEKEKEVGNKGNFSRFSIQYFVTNVSDETKIILFKQGFNLLNNDVSPTLVQFKCLNATGARFTSKESILQAKPCTIPVSIEDKDCSSGKTTQNKRLAQIGYWIKPGETISNKNIVIVPLNETPNMTATIYPGSTANIGTTVNSENNNIEPANNQGFVKLKNFSAGTYLNNQPGSLVCTTIENGWWSAEWWLMPVNGTNYYLLKNRWKLNYIATDNKEMLSANKESVNAMWIVEPVGNTNTFTIRNVGNNAYLSIEPGRLTSMDISGSQLNARWIIEK